MTAWSGKKLLEILNVAATPIDFDQLIADGILRKHGRKYEILDLERLPEHAIRKIRIIATSRKTPNHVVSFHKTSKLVIQQAKKMGLLPPD
jgi:hypothetical protein